MCIAWRGREGHSGRGFAFIHTYTYDASLPSPPLPSHPSDPPQTTNKKYDPSPPIHPIPPPPRNHQHQQYAQAYYRDAPEAGEDKELLWLGRYLVRACVDACVCVGMYVFLEGTARLAVCLPPHHVFAYSFIHPPTQHNAATAAPTIKFKPLPPAPPPSPPQQQL